MEILERINIPSSSNSLGDIRFTQFDFSKYFTVQRIYLIGNVPVGAIRGRHAHKNLEQIFISAKGSFKLTVMDNLRSETVEISDESGAFYLPSGFWRELSEFTPGAVCLVLASEQFDEKDYIRNFDSFLDWLASKCQK